jgi:hypothetical protein
MDTVVQAATILAAFSAVHERAVEYIRSFNNRNLKPRRSKTVRAFAAWLEQITKDHRNIYLPTILAFATHANLLALFQTNTAFFDEYLHRWVFDDADFVRQCFGCVLMGLSTALGSKFWHDLAGGLIDLRASAKANSQGADRPPPPADAPPGGFLVTPGTPLKPPPPLAPPMAGLIT